MATRREKRQARALADLEFDPQLNIVRDLGRQARTQYFRDVRGARNIAGAQQQSARLAEPKVKGIFGDAGRDLKQSNSYVDKALKATGRGTPTGLSALVGKAMERERGSARNANTAARASALTDLQTKITGAEAGKALALTTARGNLTSTRRELSQRLSDLTGQKGAKTSLILSDMVGERRAANRKARETRAAERAKGNKTITDGIYRGLTHNELDGMTTQDRLDYATAQEKAKQKAKPKKGRTNQDAQGRYSDQINEAASIARQRRASKGLGRHELANQLMHGTTLGPGERGQTVPKFGQLVASAALDMVFDGHISRANANELHKRKLRVSDIRGAVSYQDWLKSPAGRAWQASRLVPGLGR
jgi:hypothetical protein